MDLLERAIQLKDDGNLKEAIHLLKTSQHDVSDEERLDIAQLLQDWGHMNDAIAIYSDMLELYPEDSYVKLLLAEIYTDLGEDAKTIDLLDSIEPDDPAYLPSLIQLADMYQTQGLFEVSEQKLLEAKDIAPNEPVVDLALAELAFSIGEFQKAVPYYERIVQLDEEITAVNIKERLAESLASLGSFEEAIAYYEEIELDQPDQIFKYGYTAFQLERYPIAIEAWRKLLEADPSYTSAYPLLAASYYEEGAVEEAYDSVKKGIENDAFNPELYVQASEYAVLLSKVEEAKEYLQHALSLDPGLEEAADRLLEIYENEEDFDAQDELLNELLSYEGYPDLLLWRKAQVAYELENYDEAKEMYEKAYPTFKDNTDFLKAYGYFLLEEGQREESLRIFGEYLSYLPDDEDIRALVSRISE